MYYFFLLSKQNELIVSGDKPSFSELLSKRELEILDEYCQGKELKAIANDLFISESTVRQHIKNIYQKLKINNQRALVRLYMRDKLG
ncbi:MAG: response regulator transcription factor [Ruminococcaceae bacterium]|nr:response regulator transcription factor [Oscillospiraceae bacterium]